MEVSFSSSTWLKYDDSSRQLVLIKPISISDVGKSVKVKYVLTDGTLSAEFTQTIFFKSGSGQNEADAQLAQDTILVSLMNNVIANASAKIEDKKVQIEQILTNMFGSNVDYSKIEVNDSMNSQRK